MSTLQVDTITGKTTAGTVAMPSGSVIQVVQGTRYGSNDITSTSFVATDLSVDITPKFSTSKILITCTFCSDLGGGGAQIYATIYRDSTRLDTQTSLGGHASSAGFHTNYSTARIIFDGSMQFLDAPASSSQITYKMYGKSVTGSTVTLNAQSILNRIVAEEIAQ